jgi:murein DD-endopeptidase MepM/ murein hydrolase activator NlpD
MQKKIKLLWTFGDNKITQKFGQTEFAKANPHIYYPFRGHEGLDIGLVINTPVLAVHNGIVIIDDDVDDSPYGNYVCLYNPYQRLRTYYCHLERNIVKNGQMIRKGGLIGYSGWSGVNVKGERVCTGWHLHFGVMQTDKHGYAINTANGYGGFIDPLNEEIIAWK